MNKVINLYGGDKRLNTLSDKMMDLIIEIVGDQDIPIVAVVGLLEDIKFQLLNHLEEKRE